MEILEVVMLTRLSMTMTLSGPSGVEVKKLKGHGLTRTFKEVSFNVLLWKMKHQIKQREGYNKPACIRHPSSKIIHSWPIFSYHWKQIQTPIFIPVNISERIYKTMMTLS